MLPVHAACREVLSFRIVIDDGGTLALIPWCHHCAIALALEDCEPPKIPIHDVPTAALEQFMRVLAVDRSQMAH